MRNHFGVLRSLRGVGSFQMISPEQVFPDGENVFSRVLHGGVQSIKARVIKGRCGFFRREIQHQACSQVPGFLFPLVKKSL